MRVIIRADSSFSIGSGHIMRCLTLAYLLRSKFGVKVLFVCRKLYGNLIDLIKGNGFEVAVLKNEIATEQLDGYEAWLTVSCQQDAQDTTEVLRRLGGTDFLVVDHYALDERWETQMRRYAKKIFVIDDLANRKHDCDYLLDQTYGIDGIGKYGRLVPGKCVIFAGIEYALLRPNFYNLRKMCKVRKTVKEVMVFYGGSDDTGETLKLLHALKNVRTEIKYHFTVIVGEMNPSKVEVQDLCGKIDNVEYLCQVDNMEDYIARADIAFAAPGGNTWERCILGLPAILTITADNQFEIASQIERIGAGKIAGWHDNLGIRDYEEQLRGIRFGDIAAMSETAFSLIKGNCIDVMLENIGVAL